MFCFLSVFIPMLGPDISRIKPFHPLIKSFDRADYYRLRQWTIQSVVMDCIVCRSRLYGLLQRTVIIFRLKELSRQ